MTAKSQKLLGVRLHLSGAIPQDASEEQAVSIRALVREIVGQALSEGATVIHGSHPTLVDAIIEGAKPFIESGGSREAVVLVRTSNFAVTSEQLAEIDEQRKFAVVEVIPADPGDINQSLVPMRTWMAERGDATIVLGGRWYKANKSRSGVPIELQEFLRRGKPAFLVAGFGGAVADYLKDTPDVLSRLRNGLDDDANSNIAHGTNPDDVASAILAQAKRLPLVREAVTSGRMFRILALDGGGIRGTFTAAVLAQWAEMLGENGQSDLIKHFDLVAGTSTGAILAIGMGLGLTPLEILEFYKKSGPKIFSEPNWVGSSYDSTVLQKVLVEAFGSRKLSDSCCRLVVPTVRAIQGCADSIVTAHTQDRTAFAQWSAVDAALASAAAPTFFDDATVDTPIASHRFLDGGIWANNPTLAAVSEAVGPLGIPADRIDVLSVGTLATERDFTKALGGGKVTWATRITNLFFAAQESATTNMAEMLVGKARHLRVNQHTPEEIKLDGVDRIEEMARRGSQIGQKHFQEVRCRFLNGYSVPHWQS